MPPGEMQRLAGDYARARGGELLQLTGDVNLIDMTRRRVGQLVAESIERGDSLGKLQRTLRQDFVFSPDRARMVARTETATALGQGAKQASIAKGRDEKHWITQGDDVVDPDCVMNEDAGWLPIGDIFPSGHDVIPAHPSCRCVTRYRTAKLHEEEGVAARGYEARCPNCEKLLLRGAVEISARWCNRCKKEVVA